MPGIAWENEILFFQFDKNKALSKDTPGVRLREPKYLLKLKKKQKFWGVVVLLLQDNNLSSENLIFCRKIKNIFCKVKQITALSGRKQSDTV